MSAGSGPSSSTRDYFGPWYDTVREQGPAHSRTCLPLCILPPAAQAAAAATATAAIPKLADGAQEPSAGALSPGQGDANTAPSATEANTAGADSSAPPTTASPLGPDKPSATFLPTSALAAAATTPPAAAAAPAVPAAEAAPADGPAAAAAGTMPAAPAAGGADVSESLTKWTPSTEPQPTGAGNDGGDELGDELVALMRRAPSAALRRAARGGLPANPPVLPEPNQGMSPATAAKEAAAAQERNSDNMENGTLAPHEEVRSLHAVQRGLAERRRRREAQGGKYHSGRVPPLSAGVGGLLLDEKRR